MQLNFSNTLNDAKALLHENLNDLNTVIVSNISSNIPLIDDILNHILISKSKRFRPLLTLLSANLFNPINRHVINIAASVEFIHTATLLHDDVIDETKLRRGKQTANSIWGNKESILVGDYLFAKAFELMVSTNNIEVLNILAKASSTITAGEVLQLQAIGNINLEYENYITIITSKTGALFAAACKSGAILSGNSNNHSDLQNYENMFSYGNNLGIAFQIVDDMLDYVAKDTEIGKNPGTDLLEQKITLPIILLLKCCNLTEKNYLNHIFTSSSLSEADISTGLPEILKLFVKYNITEQTKEIIKTFVDASKTNLTNLKDVKNNQSLKILRDFADSTLNRDN